MQVRNLLVTIRIAKIQDLNQVTEIYNYAILETNATFDTEPKTIDDQKNWFKKHGKKNPIIVAEQDGKIVGWASLSKYDKKPAYSDTAELSLYIRPENQKKGIGKKLMKRIIKEGEKAGLHAIIARITDGNKVSIHLHEMFGFKHVGILREVGFKFGKRLDVYIMEKIYK
jgi:phosphinothricin acetyltransferase